MRFSALIHLFSAIALMAMAGSVLAAPGEDFLDRLEEIEAGYEFDFGADEEFARLLGDAQVAVEQALQLADVGSLPASAYWLARSVELSESAYELGVEKELRGARAAGELARLATLAIGELHVDLSDQLAFDPTVPDTIVDYLDELSESAYGASRDGDSSRAAYLYSWGVALGEWMMR